MSLSHLSYLETSGLIKLTQIQPELEYTFRHTLVHDAIYDSLLKADRRTLHRIVGETLEGLDLDNLDELAPILGWHFYEAGDANRAQKYYLRAGDLAAGKYANEEAAVHYSKALEVAIQHYPFEGSAGLVSELFLKLGRSLEQQGKYEEATKLYEDIESFAKEWGEQQLELGALIAHTTAHSVPSSTYNPEEGMKIAKRALILADTLKYPAAKAKIYWDLLLANAFLHQDTAALEYGEKSLEIARKYNLKEQLAYSLSDLANFVYTSFGEYDKGMAALEEAQQLWRELENLPLLANSLTEAGFVSLVAGDIKTGIDYSDQAYQLSLSISNLWGQSFSLEIKGYAEFEMGNVDAALPLLTEAVRLGDEGGFKAVHSISNEIQALVYTFCGDTDRGIDCIREAISFAKEHIRFWLIQGLMGSVYIYIEAGRLDLAEQAFKEVEEIKPEKEHIFYTTVEPLAICSYWLAKGEYQKVIETTDKFLNSPSLIHRSGFSPNAYYYRGLALLALDRADEAYHHFIESSAEASRIGNRWTQWKSLAALFELDKKRGNESQAEKHRQRALETINYIASHAEATNLRESFLNQPEVQKVLAE